MAISTSVFIIAISALAMLLFNVGPAESRPAFCPECTAQDIANCPTVVANATCTVVELEGCECCRTACAGREGDNCGVGRPTCEKSLICLPPGAQEEDFLYDYEDPNSPSFIDGTFVCQSLPDDIPKHILAWINSNSDEDVYDYGEYVEGQDPLTKQYEGEYPKDHGTSEDDTVIPELMPVYIPMETPPTAPFPNQHRPCQYHSEQATKRVDWQQHVDRHQWLPTCHHHGRKYQPEQCETSTASKTGRCWCVDNRGTPITGFRSRQRSSMERCEKELRRAK